MYQIGQKLTLPGIGRCRVESVLLGHNRSVVKVSNHDPTAKFLVVKAIDIAPDMVQPLSDSIRAYHAALIEVSVPVPAATDLRLFTGKADDPRLVRLFEVSPYIGADLEQLILYGTEAGCAELVSQILEGIVGVFHRTVPGDPQHVSVGLDVIPRNLTKRDDQSRVIYIDFVPPKRYLNGKFSLEIPEPTDRDVVQVGVYRHYNKLGICQVLLVQLCKLRPELKRLFEDLISVWLIGLGEHDVLRRFEALTYQNRDEPSMTLLARRGSFLDIYNMREVACELAYLKQLSAEQLNEFFAISHFQSESLSATRIKRLQTIIKTALGQPVSS